MYIPIILGTGREGRQSEMAARFIMRETQKADLETELIDVRDYARLATDNTGQNDSIKKYAEKIEKADGLIIVAPEYNHSYPGELKILLDSLYPQYEKKPLGICGVSAGGLGGARMVEQLRLVAIELKMTPIREAVYFSSVQDLFNKDGGLRDVSYYQRVKTFLDELIWYARALKTAREKNQEAR